MAGVREGKWTGGRRGGGVWGEGERASGDMGGRVGGVVKEEGREVQVIASTYKESRIPRDSSIDV